MYLISVYFDKSANKILQRYMDELARETGNNFMTEHAVPPHLTISSVEAKSAEVLRPAFFKMQDFLRSGTIQFVSVGQFLPYVFYVTPVLNAYLLELSDSVYQAVCDIPETSVSRVYTPGNWLPHVTLGKTLSKEQMRAAFAVLLERFQPFTATVTEIGLSRVNPHEDVERFFLRKVL